MQTIEHVVIAAAGRGMRLGLGMPKCLVPVAGRPIIDYLLRAVAHIPDVRLVIGYREELVLKYVKERRSDVIFVRNSNFYHTSTLQSLFMGARGISGNCVCLDGDMIISEKEFQDFITVCEEEQPLIGIADEITEDPVYAHVVKHADVYSLHEFSREKVSAYEWANIAYIPASWLNDENTYVYERLRAFLPCRAACVRRIEVDTPEDLKRADALLRGEDTFWTACRRALDAY